MMKNFVRGLIRRMVLNVMRHTKTDAAIFPPDFDEASLDIIRAVRPYTMTSIESLFAMIQAVQYVVQAGIPGSIVECGVWKGGSMMAAAHALKRLGRDDIDLYLLDTYEGMTRPTDVDVDFDGQPASVLFERMQKNHNSADWCYAPIEHVQRNMAGTGYDMTRVKLIKGNVEDTLPDRAPSRIALLRLDTDWYASTRYELIHLYPRLSKGGVLIVDDYGYWQGCRKATDEYLAKENIHLLLNRIDNTGRMAIKP